MLLFGLGFSALLLTGITQGVSRAMHLEKPSHTVGFPHLLFLAAYFAIVAKLSQSKHRSARLVLVGIAAVGYIAVFTFWTWVLLGTPTL
jgi:hypothetical protein